MSYSKMMDGLHELKAVALRLDGFAHSPDGKAIKGLTENLIAIHRNIERNAKAFLLSDEQPDPTPETPQEAVEDVFTTFAVGDHVSIYKNGKDHLSWSVSDEAMMAEYQRQCVNYGINPIELDELAPIGSHSDVSDEAVRAAGGTVGSSTQTKIVGVTEPNYPNGLSATDFDFGPKA